MPSRLVSITLRPALLQALRRTSEKHQKTPGAVMRGLVTIYARGDLSPSMLSAAYRLARLPASRVSAKSKRSGAKVTRGAARRIQLSLPDASRSALDRLAQMVGGNRSKAAAVLVLWWISNSPWLAAELREEWDASYMHFTSKN
jgi:hypothetical protein